MAYGTFTLTGTHQNPTGTPHVGSVVISPNAVIRDAAGDVILSGSVTVPLDELGHWTVALPADDPTLNPATGIGYTVSYRLHSSSLRTEFVAAQPAGTTLDMADVVSTDPTTATTTLVGPGVPDGGLTGYALVKASDADYDTVWSPAGAGGGVTDHGALTGLTDDDHPQYALADGSRGTFAATSLGRPTALVGIVGGSIEAANQASVLWGGGWPILAALKSGGKMQMVKNAAVAGTNMDHYLNAQIPALAAEKVNTIIVGGAENDIQELWSAGKTVAQAMATMRARLDALVDAIHGRGAKPVLRTTAPHYNTASHQFITAWNHYLKDYGNLRGIAVADFYRVLVDPLTGNYKSGYSQEAIGSAIHPNATSTPLIAQEFVDVATPGIYAKVPLSETKSDPGQLSANPGFLTLSGAAGTVPTGWSIPVVTGVTASTVTASGVPGNMVRLAASASAGTGQLNGPSSGGTAIDITKVSPGDVIEWSQTVVSDGGVTWTSLLAIYASSGNVYAGFGPISGSGTFTFVRRVVVPTGVTLIAPQMSIPAGTGTVDFGHPSVRNLTREGIA